MDQIESFQKEIARLNKVIEQKDAEIIRPLVETKGLKFLHEGGYIIPNDPVIRETILGILWDKLENDNTKLKVENGKIVIMDASGQPKENETGTRLVTFEELLESRAKITLERNASDNRKSPGNTVQRKVEPGNYSHLETTEDWFRALNAERDPAKRRELKEGFDKSLSNSKQQQDDTNSRAYKEKAERRALLAEDYMKQINAERDPVKQKEIKAQMDRSLSQVDRGLIPNA